MAYFRCTGNSGGSLKLRTAQGEIASFETNIIDTLQEVKCSINPIQNGTPWIDSNEVNKEPYIKRAVAGTATRIGNHLYDKLVGGTVAFNQLCNNGPTRNVGNVVGTLSNGVVTIQGTNTEESSGRPWTFPAQDNNVILFLFENPTDATKIRFYAVAGKYFSNSTIIKASTSTGNQDWGYNQKAVDSISYTSHVSIINLTAMFGSTIADYIYSLEQATAGAGVAFFKALFPNDYYAYNAGELMSVKATAHIMRNASNTVIGNYPLDSNLELRGIPKLVNNKLEYDGDEYTSDGNVLRKYGVVDLGTRNWNYSSSSGCFISSGTLPADGSNTGLGGSNKVICPKYVARPTRAWSDNYSDGQCGLSNTGSQIIIKDTSYSDATAFKTAMSGVYFQYELATPTTEQATPFTNPQVCDENGTEEYTDSRAVAIPVGHETYQANICPISGYTEANITRCGVNLGELAETNKYDQQGSSTVYENHGVNITASAAYARTSYEFKVKKGVQYTISFYGRGTGNFINVYFNDEITWGAQSYGRILLNSTRTRYTKTITATSDDLFVGFYLTTTGTSGDMVIEDFMLEVGSSASDDFHAYNGQTYTIAFGQTVYGGVLDVTRGKLHVTWGCVDLGSLTWVKSTMDVSGVYRYAADLVGVKQFATLGTAAGNIPEPLVCENYPTIGGNDGYDRLYDKTISGSFWNSANKLQVCESTPYSDGNAFKTAMSGHYLAYELATPFDIDLTPVQIEALLGVNNVFSDTNGTTEVDYKVSVAKYVNDHSGSSTTLASLTDVALSSPTSGRALKYNGTKWENANTWTDIVGTLMAGNTSITLSNAAIKTTSTIQVFTDPEVSYDTLTVSNGSATLTFDAQASDVSVKVRVT